MHRHVMPVWASFFSFLFVVRALCVNFMIFPPYEQRGGVPDIIFICSFCGSANHERDWPPCRVVISDWQPTRWILKQKE